MWRYWCDLVQQGKGRENMGYVACGKRRGVDREDVEGLEREVGTQGRQTPVAKHRFPALPKQVYV